MWHLSLLKKERADELLAVNARVHVQFDVDFA